MKVGAVLCLVAAAWAAPREVEKARLQRDGFWVDIDEYGVLTDVPSGGIETVDGPRMKLASGFRESFGVSFVRDDGVVRGHAPTDVPDWAGRDPVRPVAFAADADTATAVTRIDDMEVRTDFWFDADGEYLIARVLLTNRGPSTLTQIVYTRECVSGDPDAEGWTFPDDIGGLEPAPPELMRRAWMQNELRPGASSGLGFSYAPGSESGAVVGNEVPLALWTNVDFPAGLSFGETNGVSFGDYDADGFIDIFSCQSGNLFRNQGGTTWSLVANLEVYLPFSERRYGSSFGDYDVDGLPDIATEPRERGSGDHCFHLLQNLGGAVFQDVAVIPAIVDVQACAAEGETNCWGDVDCDGDLDLFVPIYPDWAAGRSIGNVFYRNLGPTGPAGAHRFEEYTTPGGFDNPPPDSARPEGAQFADVDSDGDMDLYSNGTLYQNQSTSGVPLVQWMTEAGSGIGLHDVLEEGTAFGDYDLDGDYDLFIVYKDSAFGVMIWENRGDGTFFAVETGVIQSPMIGLGLGLSIEDWDNDGDLDFTTRRIFRRNMLVETGTRSFTVADHSIDQSHLISATPAWGDWDKDGDLDCAIGNWLNVGYFYENTLYGPATPADERRYVRVRPLRDSVSVPAGLETEYATSVELQIVGEEQGFRRKKFTASSAGYLTQNEYSLHFGLPEDPAPADRDEDVHFGVVADFPSLPSEGTWRVDRHVNPVLGGIDFADLFRREIVVFRSGRVVLNGASRDACGSEGPRLTTAAGGLIGPDPVVAIPGPHQPPSQDEWVGIDFDTLGATRPVRIREILLDGQLRPAASCGVQSGNLLLWDVTDPAAPVLAHGGALTHSTSERNHRSYYTTDVVLETDRHYRLVARTGFVRATDVTAPVVHDGLTVNGGVSFPYTSPCDPQDFAAAATDPAHIYLSFRFGPIDFSSSYCTANPNSSGGPARISSFGSLSVAANAFGLSARGCPPGKSGLFYYGPAQIQVPFGDGVRCVGGSPFRLNPPLTISAQGTAERTPDLASPPSPVGEITGGSTWNFQFWFRDPMGPGGSGFNLTDGVSVTFCE